jgi:hypothetical protein
MQVAAPSLTPSQPSPSLPERARPRLAPRRRFRPLLVLCFAMFLFVLRWIDPCMAGSSHLRIKCNLHTEYRLAGSFLGFCWRDRLFNSTQAKKNKTTLFAYLFFGTLTARQSQPAPSLHVASSASSHRPVPGVSRTGWFVLR